MTRYLFKRIDNSALVIFRVLFGLIITIQSWGTILTGYLKNRILTSSFTFNFIGLDFIQPLPGNWMYAFYIVMGIFGVGVLLGYKYKWSISGFTLLWAYSYWMQKEDYNNHYYLLLLLSFMMIVVPANRYLSLDVKQNPELEKTNMPQWVSLLFILQISLVYIFAAVAKLYPDWLDGTVATHLMAGRKSYPVIGELLQQHWIILAVTYVGLLFDFLIAPLMLWKKTRKYAFVAAIFFHLFNSIVFQIGVFPYLAICLFIFFFPSGTIQNLGLKKKPFYRENTIVKPAFSGFITAGLIVWFFIQLALPVRHWFIPGDVLWTEEGHRLSWRMMLRSRSGYSTFKVVDKNTGEKTIINKKQYLTPSQITATATQPDMIWQFAQRLKKEYQEKGREVEIYVDARVGINGRLPDVFIKPEVNLAEMKWNYFGHNDWIMPSKMTEK